jgi:hypothetical protein
MLFVFAALWSLGASIYLLLAPLTIHELGAEAVATGSPWVEELSSQASWYEIQGLWGVILLLLFGSLFVYAGVLALKDQYPMLAATSFMAVALTFLAGFSIGPLYLPAVLALLAGWLVIGFAKIMRSSKQTSA